MLDWIIWNSPAILYYSLIAVLVTCIIYVLRRIVWEYKHPIYRLHKKGKIE